MATLEPPETRRAFAEKRLWRGGESPIPWLIAALLVAVAVLMTAVGLHVITDRISLEDEAKANGASVADVAERCLDVIEGVMTLPELREGPFDDVLTALAGSPRINGIGIYNEAGKLALAYGRPEPVLDGFVVERPLKRLRGATLRVVVARPAVLELMHDDLAIGGLLVLLVVPLTLFAAYRAYKIILVRPLDMLTEAMTEVESNVWRTVPWGGRDKVGRLVSSFNRMVEALAANEREIRDAAHRAEAAARAKDEFLANISHELRTPLNAILGFSEVLKDEMFGPLGGDRYRAYAGDIYVAGAHLLQVINNILDLSKVAAGRFEIEEAPFNVGAAVAHCLRVVSEMAERRQLELVHRPAANLPALMGDEVRVRQIVLNLLSNAIKFTPRLGRVTVVEGIDAAGGITITVADTGIGIHPSDIARAFEAFGQIENVLNRSHEGSGLGLPIARALAELHGATLELESVPDHDARGNPNDHHGTTVTVRFPPERSLAVDVPPSPLRLSARRAAPRGDFGAELLDPIEDRQAGTRASA